MSAALVTSGIAERFECPSCSAYIVSYDPASSAYYACPACKTYSHKEGRALAKVTSRWPKGPEYVPQALPLGGRGIMPDGLPYTVVGYMARKEAKHTEVEYKWGEYVLFSPPDKYAQLAVYEGHWMFIKPSERAYKVGQASSRNAYVEAEDDRYELYNRYSPRVMYAVGEFDWDIREDERLSINEFIAPPYMLVQERKPNKSVEWYKAEYVEAKQIAKAFGVEKYALPDTLGVGAIEPAPGDKSWATLLSFSLLMALLVVITQITMLAIRPERQLINQQFSSQLDAVKPASVGAGSEAVIISSSFEVEGPAAISVELRSALDNQWLEVPAVLVNEKTGQQFEFSKTLEYYHGYEDGESWSEGSQSEESTLAKVPSGRYHLNLYPATEAGLDLPISLTVSQQSSLHSNAVLLLLALFLYPGIQFWRRSYYEHKRWENSDYGPTT